MLRFFAITTILGLAMAAHAEPDVDSEEQAVIDIRNVVDDPAIRPSHVTPALPGSFGELADPHLRALHPTVEALSKLNDDGQAAKDVLAGRQPLAKLPQGWLTALEATREDTSAVLRATHAVSGRLPTPLTMFGMFSKDEPPYDNRDAQRVVDLATLRVLLAVRDHQPGAIDTCLDELALIRDFARGALVNAMTSTANLRKAQVACVAALRSASAADRGRFRSGLATIRSGWPTFAVTLRYETVFFDLIMLDHMSKDTQAQVPESARLQLSNRQKQSWMASVRGALFGGWARRAQVRRMRELEAASSLAPKEADPKFERLGRDAPLALGLWDSDSAKPSDWLGFLKRFREGQTRLVMLDTVAAVLDAREKLGHWPASWAEVGSSAPLDPRTGLPMSLIPDGKGVRIQPVPDGARTEDDLGIELD